MKYLASATIYIENLNHDDNHSSERKTILKLSGSLKIRDTVMELSTTDNIAKARIPELIAESDDDAYVKTKMILESACNAFGFIAQKWALKNPGIGHINYYFNNGEIKVLNLERTTNLGLSHVSLIGTSTLNISDAEQIANLSYPSSVALIGYFYDALARADYRLKFFSLFCIIEFIEKNLTVHISPTRLLSDVDIDTLSDTGLSVLGLETSKMKTISGRISSELKKATIETRKDKLAKILTSYLGVSEAKPLTPITPEYVSEFIKLRNSLFHGGTPPENLIELTSNLTVLCVKIIEAMIRLKI